MRKKLLCGALLMYFAATPMIFSAAPQKTKPTRGYAEGLGELKDRSDKFTFARIRYGPPPSAGEELGDHGPMWSHDFPDAGLHLMKILSEVSKLDVTLDTNEYIFSFTDPNLFKYPLAYLCEVGYMDLSQEEIAGMREYLLRGGFLLVDDFHVDYRGGGDWQFENFARYVKLAFPEPEYQIKDLDITHPIFNCFFSIKTLDVRPPYGNWKPHFMGLEDKHGRLMMIINYNNDVSDFWQWSGDPFQPLPAEDTNGAYKFGVNYIFYALTH